MSLTLVTNPVETVGGVVNNIFAGFEDTEFVFSRKDLSNVSITAGAGTNVRIDTNGNDLTTKISVGDAVYLYAVGSTYTYNKSGLITVVSATYIEADISFIENATVSASNYINYYKNYYVECELVNVDNSDVKLLPFTLRDDGNDAGSITINVGIANDLNTIDYEFTTQQLTDSVTKFKFQYRQVYTLDDGDVTDSYTLVSDEIILVYATVQPDIESYITQFENPKIYSGYPFGVVMCHSDDNKDDDFLSVRYEQLDINHNSIISGTEIVQINDEYGLIFIDFTNEIISGDAQFIRFTSAWIGAPDWLSADWLPADWSTT